MSTEDITSAVREVQEARDPGTDPGGHGALPAQAEMQSGDISQHDGPALGKVVRTSLSQRKLREALPGLKEDVQVYSERATYSRESEHRMSQTKTCD